MCRYLRDSAIRENTARDRSTQFNIQVIIGDITAGLPASEHLREELPIIVSTYLQSLVSNFSLTESGRMNGDSTMVAQDFREFKSPDSLRTTCFPMLKELLSRPMFSERCVDGYHGHSCPAIETLESRSLKELSAWLESSSSEILLVDADEGLVDPSWMIDLLLETAAILTDTLSKDERDPCATITHICPKSTGKTKFGPEIVLQDFLAQIIEIYHITFVTDTDCKSAANDSKKLWALITNCIDKVKIHTLVILIHSIEELFLEGYRRTGKDEFQFAQEFSELIRVLHIKHGITVKTMVTSQLKEATGRFKDAGAKCITILGSSNRSGEEVD
ncbi:hypothetical protein F4678DRAFT_314027 [Xylaria arbuscula]|nr:hypothetical protein F4678DRAFT_314027 [Xylaria arbuscula]